MSRIKETVTGLELPSNAKDLMAAEASLMEAAIEFSKDWGSNQTSQPKLHWLDLHLKRWRSLAISALRYTEAVDAISIEKEPNKENP